MFASVQKVLKQYWQPITQLSDLVLWDRREFNSYADHAANVALDLKSDWNILDSQVLEEARRSKANIRATADGARRGDGQAAAGIAFFAYFPGGRRVIFHRAGKLLGKLSSAFLAEALAMEWCLESFITFLGLAATKQFIAILLI